MTVLAAILGFHLLVVVHELGHFLAARAVGMRVLAFRVGFGPALMRIERGGTTYTFGLLPLGGLVQVEGLNGPRPEQKLDADGLFPAEAGPAGGSHGNPDDDAPDSYHRKRWSQRVAMVMAGPAFNLAFAGLLFLGLFLTFNTMRHEGATQGTTFLAAVEPGGPAEAAGLRAGDVIVAVDGEATPTFGAVLKRVGGSEGHPLQIAVRRPPPGAAPTRRVEAWDAEGEPGLLFAYPQYDADWPEVTLTATPAATGDGYRLGVTPVLFHFGADNPLDALRYAFRETWAINRGLAASIGRMLRGEEKPQVTSIVKLSSVGADRIRLGIADWYLDLLALISVNLALFNLLPLPALDGGRLLFLAAEAVMRRPVPRRFEAWVHAAGFALLLGTLLVVMGQELWERLAR